MKALAADAREVLQTPGALDKTAQVAALARAWNSEPAMAIGAAPPPDRPARPDRPILRPPRDMPRRGKAASRAGRIALLHALAHIELNAVDLACDILCRYTDAELPRAFYDDWVSVAADEAKHFELLAARLAAMGAAYGDLPAHDGLWEAAIETAHDPLARLAVVPLVLEARGLDVTPAMIANLRRAGDDDSADVIQVIQDEEITHVASGRRWFDHLCRARGLDPIPTYHALVRRHFKGSLKPPFNTVARDRAGLTDAFYGPLAQ